MLFHIATALTLLALVAGMYLLAKTKTEALGKFYSFISWLIIVVSGLMLIFSMVHACMNMCCHGGGRMIEREYRIEDRGHMGHHGMGDDDEECGGMRCGGEDEGMDCCKGMKGGEGMDHCKGMMKEKETEEKIDTVKH